MFFTDLTRLLWVVEFPVFLFFVYLNRGREVQKFRFKKKKEMLRGQCYPQVFLDQPCCKEEMHVNIFNWLPCQLYIS